MSVIMNDFDYICRVLTEESHTMHSKFTIKDCGPIELPTHADHRGSLTVIDDAEASLLPFRPERVFWIHGAGQDAVRGEHAHRTCWEIVCAVSGSFSLTLSDGLEEKTFLMDSPTKGVIIPPMIWCRLEHFAPGTVCLTIASGSYDAEGYINNLEQLKPTQGDSAHSK